MVVARLAFLFVFLAFVDDDRDGEVSGECQMKDDRAAHLFYYSLRYSVPSRRCLFWVPSVRGYTVYS